MVADAIRDCSNRNGVILDPWRGAGTALIAAEKTGRRARLIEIDPLFVDTSIERWQRLTWGCHHPSYAKLRLALREAGPGLRGGNWGLAYAGWWRNRGWGWGGW
jgi:hypothetical protein